MSEDEWIKIGTKEWENTPKTITLTLTNQEWSLLGTYLSCSEMYCEDKVKAMEKFAAEIEPIEHSLSKTVQSKTGLWCKIIQILEHIRGEI